MASLIIVLGCLALGVFLGRSGRMPKDAAKTLNAVVIRVSLPCVVFHLLHGIGELGGDELLPVLMPWLVFAGALVLFNLLGRARGWSRSTIGALVLVTGLGNTSFLGYPLIETLRGAESLRFAVLADQFGTFLALSTVGIAAAAWYSSGRASPRMMLRRMLSFPPFLAAVLAIALRGVPMPGALMAALTRVGETMAPLALLSVGLQLSFKRRDLKRAAWPLAAGLAYKLCIAPLAILLIYRGLLGARGDALEISVLESAMAPMITAAVLAAEEGLDSELSGLLISVGVPLSLATVPAIDWLLRHML